MEINTIFEASYRNFKTYPENLIYQTLAKQMLVGYNARLLKAANELCGAEEDMSIGFQDFNDQSQLYKLPLVFRLKRFLARWELC